MNKTEIRELFKINLDEPRKAILEFISNPENSFEDRREIWRATPKHLQVHESYWPDFSEYEDVYGSVLTSISRVADRYQTVYLPDLADMTPFKGATPEQKRAFEECCMKQGIHSFTFDW